MKQFPLTLLLISSFCGFAQSKFTLSGKVEDGTTGESLPGVYIKLGESGYTITDSLGFFSATLPQGKQRLVFSFLGYERIVKDIDLTQNREFEIQMQPAISQLEEVQVVAKERKPERASAGSISLSVREIERIPPSLGEIDVVKALQHLPGVQGGVEGSSGFFVRGGSIDQNLILLDGIPVYNASHLMGLYSVFNSDIIEDVSITKGGFPARFGGRLSSVLEIDIKDGDFQEYHGEGAISLVAPKFSINGPIIKDKTSFVISGRRTIYDWVIKPFLPDDEQILYYFGDINAKVTHRINENHRLSLNYFHSIDEYSSLFNYDQYQAEYLYGLDWGNHIASLNWEHKLTNSTKGNLRVFASNYRFSTSSDQRDSADQYQLQYQTRIRDLGAKYDLVMQPFRKHTLRVGAAFTSHFFEPGAVQNQIRVNGNQNLEIRNISENIYSNDVSFYAEDHWKITPKLGLNAGLHHGIYQVQNSTYSSLQPRFEARYYLKPDWAWSASYSKMTQFIHLLSNTGMGLPTDLWVSATDRVPPQQSQQVSFGSENLFNDGTYLLNAQVFYKEMTDLIEYEEGASYMIPTDWQYLVETGGRGTAYGLEVLLKKQKGKTTGWVSYTFSRTIRQFENLNDGEPFPYRYDRPHDISIVANHRFTDNIDAGLMWVYSTGLAFTAPEARQYALHSNWDSYWMNAGYLYYSDRNAHRYPNYHRLDLSVNFRKKTSWGSRVLNFSIYNAYSRINAFFIYVRREKERNKLTKVGLFPILPSVSYKFQF